MNARPRPMGGGRGRGTRGRRSLVRGLSFGRSESIDRFARWRDEAGKRRQRRRRYSCRRRPICRGDSARTVAIARGINALLPTRAWWVVRQPAYVEYSARSRCILQRQALVARHTTGICTRCCHVVGRPNLNSCVNRWKILLCRGTRQTVLQVQPQHQASSVQLTTLHWYKAHALQDGDGDYGVWKMSWSPHLLLYSLRLVSRSKLCYCWQFSDHRKHHLSFFFAYSTFYSTAKCR